MARRQTWVYHTNEDYKKLKAKYKKYGGKCISIKRGNHGYSVLHFDHPNEMMTDFSYRPKKPASYYIRKYKYR